MSIAKYACYSDTMKTLNPYHLVVEQLALGLRFLIKYKRLYLRILATSSITSTLV